MKILHDFFRSRLKARTILVSCCDADGCVHCQDVNKNIILVDAAVIHSYLTRLPSTGIPGCIPTQFGVQPRSDGADRSDSCCDKKPSIRQMAE